MVPKAELHLHLEGAAGPDLVRRLAARHGAALPETLFDAAGRFAWTDFLDFLRVYDIASSFIRTAADYEAVTYDYLVASAAEGAIYVELMSSPQHAAMAGLSYEGHLDGIAAGIVRARAETGIEARIVVTCVRQFGVEAAVMVARRTVRHPHPLVTGFGMGGDEEGFPPGPYLRAFRIAHEEAGLGCTIHAGEAAGPESVWAAIDLPVQRIGHGVRAIEDEALVAELADRDLVLEVCPTSNIATGVYAVYSDHPFRRLIDAGVRVTLASDDPPYFGTSIGREYAVAGQFFGMDEVALRRVTRHAVEAAFVDPPTRAALLDRLNSAKEGPAP
jgi:adenosine deaminase